jgi:hypothetical protein
MNDLTLQAIELCTSNQRVCPQPVPWNDLYKLLARHVGRIRVGRPPSPLILAAWWEADDAFKAERVKEQLEWAAAHGALDAALVMLRSLSEDQWHHSRSSDLQGSSST